MAEKTTKGKERNQLESTVKYFNKVCYIYKQLYLLIFENAQLQENMKRKVDIHCTKIFVALILVP